MKDRVFEVTDIVHGAIVNFGGDRLQIRKLGNTRKSMRGSFM